MLYLLLLVLTFQPVTSSGGVSVFLQNLELLPLAISLTLLITLTVTFELVLHGFKHRVATWTTSKRTMTIVIEKVTSELTVLGFISVLVLIVANSLSGDPTISAYLPELEVAHLWLFFVGMMYVVEAFILLKVKQAAEMHYDKAESRFNLFFCPLTQLLFIY
jgi:hypothetical protein